MSTKVVTFQYTERGLQEASAYLERYAQELEAKANALLKQMLREGESYAKIMLDHYYTGETRNSIIGYRMGKYGILSVGGAAVWIEFGTGTSYNDELHPEAIRMGMSPHGTYGYGYGNANEHPNGWHYFKNGKWHHTKGIPQNRFFYNTAQMLRKEYTRMATEVFK